MTWVLIDENAVGINDAGFGFGMVVEEWVDYPGWYHSFACGLAFADGHSEVHKWKEGSTLIPVKQKTVDSISLTVPSSRDIGWMGEHSTTRRN